MNTKIAKAFVRADTFASRDEARPALCGVLYRDGKLVATDGHRLIVIDLGCAPWSAMFIVPSGAISAMKADNGNGVEVSEAGTKVVAMDLIPHLNEGFPDYTRVLPESIDDGTQIGTSRDHGQDVHHQAHVINVDGTATVTAIVAAFACGKWNATDKLRAKIGKLKLPTIKREVSVLLNGAVYIRADGTWSPESARAAGFDVPADYDPLKPFPPEPIKQIPPPQWKPEGEYVQCNGKYVKDALEGAGLVRVQWTSQFDPVRIDRLDGETHVVMPLRHN